MGGDLGNSLALASGPLPGPMDAQSSKGRENAAKKKRAIDMGLIQEEDVYGDVKSHE